MMYTRGKNGKKRKNELIINNSYQDNEKVFYSSGCRGTDGHDRL